MDNSIWVSVTMLNLEKTNDPIPKKHPERGKVKHPSL